MGPALRADKATSRSMQVAWPRTARFQSRNSSLGAAPDLAHGSGLCATGQPQFSGGNRNSSPSSANFQHPSRHRKLARGPPEPPFSVAEADARRWRGVQRFSCLHSACLAATVPVATALCSHAPVVPELPSAPSPSAHTPHDVEHREMLGQTTSPMHAQAPGRPSPGPCPSPSNTD